MHATFLSSTYQAPRCTHFHAPPSNTVPNMATRARPTYRYQQHQQHKHVHHCVCNRRPTHTYFSQYAYATRWDTARTYITGSA